jgi:hypothetical protein
MQSLLPLMPRNVFCRLQFLGVFLLAATYAFISIPATWADEPTRLPSMNNFGLLYALPSDGTILSSSKLTREELDKLLLLRRNLFQSIRDSLKDNEEGGKFFRTGIVDAPTQLDESVKEKILEIIPPAKYDLFYPALMQSRFPYAWSPFVDREVNEFCGISVAERATLTSLIRDVQKSYIETEKKILDENAKRLAEKLPLHSRERFVQLATNYYLPNLNDSADVNLDTIPFPKTINPSVVAVRLGELEAAFGTKLTSPEQEKIYQVCMEYVGDIGSIVCPEESQENIQAKGQQAGKRMQERVAEIIGPKRMTRLLQQLVQLQFRNSPSLVLKEDSICSYLELSPEEIEQIRKEANDTEMNNQEQLGKTKRACFDKLAEVLSEGAKEKIDGLFIGHWERDFLSLH